MGFKYLGWPRTVGGTHTPHFYIGMEYWEIKNPTSKKWDLSTLGGPEWSGEPTLLTFYIGIGC